AFWDTIQQQGMHPGSASWQPVHANSKWRWRRKREGLVEAIAMINEVERKGFGFMMNRSWNHLTQGTGSCVQAQMSSAFNGSNACLSTMQTAEHRKHRLRLKGLPRGKYVITYFQWNGGEWEIQNIHMHARWGISRMIGFPDLSADNPFAFFVIEKR
ncbi:MAG: hypothetical protein ACKO6L_03380, partial [Flavobacteriales bacterium]